MVALVKPGGVVALHEADWGINAYDPPLAALDRLLELFVGYSKANGIDPFVARRLPRMLRVAGLQDVQVNPIVHVYPLGDPRRMILLQFAENLRDGFERSAPHRGETRAVGQGWKSEVLTLRGPSIGRPKPCVKASFGRSAPCSPKQRRTRVAPHLAGTLCR